jgi:signal transduction histidine kinase/CheY-like chemotaxis protein
MIARALSAAIPRQPVMPLVGAVGDPVRGEQVGVVFRQMPIALAVNMVNAALTAIVLTPLAAGPMPLAWAGAVGLVTAGRWLLWRRYRRAAPSVADADWWSRAAFCGSLAAGLAWGAGGAMLLAEVPAVGQIFLTFVIGGMCTGATILSASHLPTLLAFLLPASLPLAARFLMRDEATDIALGAMIVVFAAALSLAGAYLNRIVSETMLLRLDLDRANARLQAEIAGHRAADAALRQAQKLEAIGQLTGGIAHDFNNLLTVVIGNLMLAGARAGDAAAVTPLLQGALHAAERGVALIQRLLAFARRQRLDPQSVDLRALVGGLEELLRRTLGPQIALRVESSGAAPAHVDSGQLELAILNLAINARDAMPAGGALRIVIEGGRSGGDAPFELRSGNYVVLSVVDDGTGMDEAILARVFDPFFTTKEVGAGSGLGLPMVQGFAAQSGGGVCIRSRPGKGTTVELWLPRAREAPPGAEASSRRPAEAPLAAAEILLCSGDEEIGRFVAGWLSSAGYVVFEARGPSAALRILEGSGDIRLLIVDYAMPEMTGLEVIRYARQRRPDLKPLLIGGGADEPPGEEVAGVPVLRKPFAPAELTQRVEELLAGRPPARAAAATC